MVWLAAGCPGISERPPEPALSLWGSCCGGVERAIPVSARFCYAKKASTSPGVQGSSGVAVGAVSRVPQETGPGPWAAAEPLAPPRLLGAERDGAVPLGWCSPDRGGPRATLTCSCGEAAVAGGRCHPAWRFLPQERRRQWGRPQTAAAPCRPACCAPRKGPGKRLCPRHCGKA